ncbi:hypothetical protein FQR65_LT20712 [Abscondita terminalis]|nr:hypothetical protein FQR65_LT20712 [Abscondita terminalis]
MLRLRRHIGNTEFRFKPAAMTCAESFRSRSEPRCPSQLGPAVLIPILQLSSLRTEDPLSDHPRIDEGAPCLWPRHYGKRGKPLFVVVLRAESRQRVRGTSRECVAGLADVRRETWAAMASAMFEQRAGFEWKRSMKRSRLCSIPTVRLEVSLKSMSVTGPRRRHLEMAPHSIVRQALSIEAIAEDRRGCQKNWSIA